MRETNEVERIKKAYEKRNLSGRKYLYALLNPASLFIIQQREKEILKTLSRFSIGNLSDKKILELGCGIGGVMRDFIRYGAIPENLYGIDLLPDRIEDARKINPNINFKCINAEKLPYKGDYFDIVLLFTVFTSIFDFKMKKNIASEILRVLKPDGNIIYYDYKYNNPYNPDVRGVGKKDILSLFPNCTFDFTITTLAPPIARAIVPYSWLLCYLLEKIPLLRTHYLVTIQKK